MGGRTRHHGGNNLIPYFISFEKKTGFRTQGFGYRGLGMFLMAILSPPNDETKMKHESNTKMKPITTYAYIEKHMAIMKIEHNELKVYI